MRRLRWLLVSGIFVLSVDTLSWFTRTWLVAGVPGSIIIFGVSIIGCATSALLLQRRAGRYENEILLSDGRRMRFRGEESATGEVLELQKLLVAKVERMEERFATRQDTEQLLAYLRAIEQEASVRSEREQISQRTQAVVTTLIGLIGGWLPSLLATIATPPNR